MKIISVLDYGSSNLHSVVKALEHVADRSYDILVSSRADQILWGINNLVDCVFTLEVAVGACVPSPIIGEQEDNVRSFALFSHITFSLG